MLAIKYMVSFQQSKITAKSFDLTILNTIFTKSKNLVTCRLEVCL